MIYFKCYPVIEDGELLGFVAPQQLDEQPKHFYYDPPANGYEIHALDITLEQAEEVMLLQHQQCEVEQVDFSSIEEELKACRLYEEINSRTVSKIRATYDINREFSIMKLDKSDPEYVAMVEYINLCRDAGTLEKIAVGLKQP